MTRAFAYLRISLDPNRESISPERQRHQIEEHATRRGDTITDWFEDRHRSAWRRGVRRPAFEQLLARLDELPHNSGIYVYELSRADRIAARTLGLLDELDRRHLVLYSVTQGDSQTGRLPLGIYALVDEEESRRISRRTTLAHRHNALVLGRPVAPHRSYGFDYDPSSRQLTPIPQEAAVVQAMADWYLQGHGDKEIARALNDGRLMGAPVAPLRGEQWGSTSVRRLLTSPTIAGWISYRREIVGDTPTQPALIALDTWNRMQAARQARARAQRRPSRGEGLLLYGLAKCAGCGGPMSVNDRNDRWPSYRCTRSSSSGRLCDEPAYMPVSWLDAHVSAWFLRHLDEIVAGEVDAYRSRAGTDPVADLRREAQQLEGAIDRLMDSYALHTSMSREAYGERLHEYEVRLGVLREKITDQQHTRTLQDAVDVERLREAWRQGAGGVRDRREALMAYIERVDVRQRPRGRVPSDLHVSIVPR